mgnify:FL=1
MNEILNASTHGLAAILSIVGLIFLIYKAIGRDSVAQLVAYSVYGASLILLYLSSTFYHIFKFTKIKEVMQRLDHATIFVLIAGSYTPYTVVVIGGWVGAIATAAIWLIALFGVLYKTFWFNRFTNLSTWLYIGMGWISLFLIYHLFQGMGWQGIAWLAAGGVAFTVGTLFYQLKKVKFMHVVWHLFVMLGTTCMFISIYHYI